MAISFHAGVTIDATAAASLGIVIPAAVSAGDVVFVVFSSFTTAGTTLTVSSTGTAPTLLASVQSPLFSGNIATVAVCYVIASATDPGKVITATRADSANANWASALGAWTGARTVSPVDVSGNATAAGAGTTITCPTLSSGAAGDWALQFLGGASSGASFSGGAGFTQRESDTPGSGVIAAIYDSNASVGGIGSSVGGAVFSSGSNSNWWAGFTVGLAPPSAAPPVVTRQQQQSGRSMLRKRLMTADV